MKNNIFRDLKKSDIPCVLYHGTTSQHNIGSDNKIVPYSQSGNVTEPGRKKNLDRIFLTPDFSYAKVYAGRAVRLWKGNPVVYRVIPLNAQLLKSGQGSVIVTADGGFVVEQYNIN